MSRTTQLSVVLCAATFFVMQSLLYADDWPMLGRDQTRNAVSLEQNPPLDWKLGEFDRQTMTWAKEGTKNIKWTARLGNACIAQPVISNGLVWLGSNNANPDFPDAEIDMATLLCFRESDGKLLYRYATPRLPGGRSVDYPRSPIGSSPLVEGERLWFFNTRGEIICWDIGPLIRGEDAPRDVWKVDLREQLGVHVHAEIMFFERRCSIASYHDWIYVITNNGVDQSGITIPNPEAPTLVCFDKQTGDVVWTDNSPGKNILRSQPASPLVIDDPGHEQVVVPMGDGWVRAFDPRGDGRGGSKLLWEFDMNRKETKWSLGGSGTRNQILSTPVYYRGRVYLANGQQPEHGEGDGRLVCLDPTKSGDISSELAIDAQGNLLPKRRLQAVDSEQGERAIPNPNSGLVWEFTRTDHDGDGQIDFEEEFHRTVCNVAVQDDLVIATDSSGIVHCLDAKTGKRYWGYDTFAQVRSSPLIVDQHVYIADQDGDVAVFKLAQEPIAEINIAGPRIDASPIFANGVLYLPTTWHLIAIAGEEPASTETAAADSAPAAHQVSKATDRQRPRVGKDRAPDAVFVPTPPDVVERMLRLARVSDADKFYDLGSGDGRIVITAARQHGAQAVGVEIDPELVRLSREKVKEHQLEKLVTIEHEDMFLVDLSGADVVAAFLYPRLLERLIPQFNEMKPGSRIVSHHFALPDVRPDQVVTVDSEETGDKHRLYLWTTPLKPSLQKPE